MNFKFSAGLFSRLFYIGLPLVFGKYFLFMLPYFTSTNEYNEFNKVYYYSSALSVLAAFGFEFAFTRIKIRYWLIILLLAFNILTSAVLLYPFGVYVNGLFPFIAAVIISLFSLLFFILSFEVLFESFYKKYFYSHLILALMLLMVLLLHKISGGNLIVLYLSALILSYIAGMFFFNKGSRTGFVSIKEFYTAGTYAFIINSASGLAFVLDKYLATHFFSPDIAAAYTFSWILASPMLYIGNIFEKYIYSGDIIEGTAKYVRQTFIFLPAALAAYFLMLLTLIMAYPGAVPVSINRNMLLNIFPIMAGASFLFILLHTPLNAILFKSAGAIAQKTIMTVYTGVIAIFCFIIYLVNKGAIQLNYSNLLLIIWTYLFSLLLIKFMILKRHYLLSKTNVI